MIVFCSLTKVRAKFTARYHLLGITAVVCLLLAGGPNTATPQLPRSNPFSPTSIPAKYERSRDYDLLNVLLRLSVDWNGKTFGGSVVHTLAPLRDGLSDLKFDAGPGLRISRCLVGTTECQFTHGQGVLTVKSPYPLACGQQVKVGIDYAALRPAAGQRSAGTNPGFRWVLPDRFEPARKPGFWTSGWPETNHFWIPIYDYPNDRATTEAYITVPSGWFVLSNGALKDIVKGKTTDTYHWKSHQTLSTYLLSLAGGEMDVIREHGAGTDLIYAVPRGERSLIRPSFGHTADMIAFFSRKLRVPYPWAKYGQSAVFDFIFGGMENASATTMAENPLAEPRSGPAAMDSLVSHELAHQWFGDLVTYLDWSQAWLSEGFATYFQELYTEYSQGKDAFDRDREASLQAYLSESRRYKRPIVTRHYLRPDNMLDSHSYPKAALVLHMLRRQLGDADFFRALGGYLRKHAYAVVDTNDLARAIAQYSGRNVEPFFDQWVYKPGHPVLDYTWTYDGDAKQIVVDVTQSQDTKDGTPVYDLPLKFGIITNGVCERKTIELNQAAQQFKVPSAQRPDMVLLDPDHDLLIERKPYNYAARPMEQEFVAKWAPSSVDREAAAIAMTSGEVGPVRGIPGAETMQILQRETSPAAIAGVLRALAPQKKAGLRPYYREYVKHKDGRVRVAAIQAIAVLPKIDEDLNALRAMINDREELGVISAALKAIGGWDADGNIDVIRKAIGMDSRHEAIRLAAVNALNDSSSEPALALVQHAAARAMPRSVRRSAVDLLSRKFLDKPHATQTMVDLVKDEDPRIREAAVSGLIFRNDIGAVEALRGLEQSAVDPAIKSGAKRAADGLEGK